MAQFKVYKNPYQDDAILRRPKPEPWRPEPTDLSAACGIIVGAALGVAAWGLAALLYFAL